MAYKVVINSFYGTLGRDCFLTFYNPVAAGDCTKMIRTIIKKFAKTCEENGFRVIYGFTDNVVVSIPKESSKEDLMIMVDAFVKDVKNNVPFPMNTFGFEVDKEYKFICIFEKNCYLWVDKYGNVGNTKTLLDKNTPQIIMDVFNNFMCPKIIKNLDVDFTEEELTNYIKEVLKDNVLAAAKLYNVKPLNTYKSKTSKEAQISKLYGEGQHTLIPNLKGIGMGKAKSTKKKIGVRHCSINEFEKNNITYEDVDVSKLLDELKRFIPKEVKA